MKRMLRFFQERTYMDFIATLHLFIMAIIAWSLMQIAPGYFSVDVNGYMDVSIDTYGIEARLDLISHSIDHLRSIIEIK